MLVEDDDQLAKLDDYRTRTPRLAHVLAYADLDELRARARARVRRGASGRAGGGDCGREPGGRLHLHLHVGHDRAAEGLRMIRRNYYAMAAVVDEIDDFTMSDDTMLLYLPLAHNFGG